MGKVALCGSDLQSRTEYLCSRQLPVNYMEDYTLMGFVVDDYQEAVCLLLSEGYQLITMQKSADIVIEYPEQLQLIGAVFTSHNIHCEYSDIADTLYQA